MIATSPGLPTTTNESSFLPKSYESIRAANLQDKAFPQAGHVTASAAIIVFSRADGGKLTPADSAKGRSVAASLGARHIHNIVGVTAGIGDQPALADHQQVVGGQGHLAHQVAGDQHGAALGSERPHKGPDPADAVGVEAVHRFVEDEHGRAPRSAEAMPSR